MSDECDLFGRAARRTEQLRPKEWVAGSNPAAAPIGNVAEWLKALVC